MFLANVSPLPLRWIDFPENLSGKLSTIVIISLKEQFSYIFRQKVTSGGNKLHLVSYLPNSYLSAKNEKTKSVWHSALSTQFFLASVLKNAGQKRTSIKWQKVEISISFNFRSFLLINTWHSLFLPKVLLFQGKWENWFSCSKFQIYHISHPKFPITNSSGVHKPNCTERFRHFLSTCSVKLFFIN